MSTQMVFWSLWWGLSTHLPHSLTESHIGGIGLCIRRASHTYTNIEDSAFRGNWGFTKAWMPFETLDDQRTTTLPREPLCWRGIWVILRRQLNFGLELRSCERQSLINLMSITKIFSPEAFMIPMMQWQPCCPGPSVHTLICTEWTHDIHTCSFNPPPIRLFCITFYFFSLFNGELELSWPINGAGIFRSDHYIFSAQHPTVVDGGCLQASRSFILVNTTSHEHIRGTPSILAHLHFSWLFQETFFFLLVYFC